MFLNYYVLTIFMESIKDFSEWVRNKLNSLPEHRVQEDNYRLGWQIITYIFGSAAEESTNPRLRLLGKSAKRGAKQSFIDFVVKKIDDWLENPVNNNPYQLTKSCHYCGWAINSWSNYCPYCLKLNQ